jgi:ABC-2 type transport system ATP-binding protein
MESSEVEQRTRLDSVNRSRGAEAVRAESLTIRHRGTRSPQVDGVTFDIGEGVTALIGRNGAGKSTLLRAIVGLQPVTSGTLRVLDTDLGNKRISLETLGRIGYLPQDFGFVNSFTASEFVTYGAWLKKVPSAGIDHAVAEALDFAGLSDQASTKMRKLSGGMRRRAGIAQAIVHQPDLLILDEPTTGLDPEQRVRFRELVRSLSENRTVIMSSHLVEDVQALASRVLVLDRGKVRFDGSPAQLELLGESGSVGDSLLERGYICAINEESPSR